MRAWIVSSLAAAKANAPALVASAGLGSMFGGLWWVYPPSALIVVGALVFGAVAWTHCRGGYG